MLAVWHSALNTFPNNSLIEYKSQVAMLCEYNLKKQNPNYSIDPQSKSKEKKNCELDPKTKNIKNCSKR